MHAMTFSKKIMMSAIQTWATTADPSLNPAFPVPEIVLTLLLAGSNFLIWKYKGWQKEEKIQLLRLLKLKCGFACIKSLKTKILSQNI